MRKGKKTPSGKPRKHVRRAHARPRSPEWEVLEERYGGLSADFGRLAEMLQPRDE
jgi:hypothetical protein